MLNRVACVVTLGAALGCGDGHLPGSGGAGAGGDATTGPGGSGGSVAGAGGAGGTGGSTGGTGGSGGAPKQPCTPLSDATAPTPTPGTCEGNVAITCGQDGFVTTDPCEPNQTCTTYELQEWRWSATDAVWEEARSVTWAGCLPTGVESCEMVPSGSQYVPATPAHCDGKDKRRCRLPPAPDLSSNSPQQTYGTEVGYWEVETCLANEKCAGSDSLYELTCIDEDTPPCDGSEPFCDGNAQVECQGTWESLPGYRVPTACPAGDTCYDGPAGPMCAPPGSTPCDYATFEPHCSPAGDAIVACVNGWVLEESCATCSDGTQAVPCRCDDRTSVSSWQGQGASAVCSEKVTPACVPQTQADCTPGVDVDYCNGNVAMRCLGSWEPTDCASHGLICDTAAGRAGCRAADAAACSSQQTCDGTEVVGCCSCGKEVFIFAPPYPPCVPGYEVRSDCADLGNGYSCGYPSFGPECIFAP